MKIIISILFSIYSVVAYGQVKGELNLDQSANQNSEISINVINTIGVSLFVRPNETFSSGGANNLFVAIDLSDPSGGTANQVILNNTSAANSVDVIGNIAYIDLGASSLSGGISGLTVTKHFELRLNCPAVNIVDYTGYTISDKVNISFGKTTTYLSTTLYAYSHSPVLRVVSVPSNGYDFAYDPSYPYITPFSHSNLDVNSIDLINNLGQLTKTTKFIINKVGNSNNVFDLDFQFHDVFNNCNNNRTISQVQAEITTAAGAVTTINLLFNIDLVNLPICTLTTDLKTVQVHYNDQIAIIETFDFPNYTSVCVSDCGNDNFLNWSLNYGYNNYSFNGTFYSDLCHSITNIDQIERGLLKPNLRVERISPAATGVNPSAPEAYWDQNFTSSFQDWVFRITNDGTNLTADVARKLNLEIFQQPPFSSFYFITQGDLVLQSTPSHWNVTGQTFTPYASGAAQPLCAGTYSSDALINARFDIEYLYPGESFELKIHLNYCCNSADDYLFDREKLLNSWGVKIGYKDDCNTDAILFGSNGYGMTSNYEISLNGQAGLYMNQNFSPTVTDLDVNPVGHCSNSEEFQVDINKFNLLSYDNSNDIYNSNFFNNRYDLINPSSMIMDGSIVFEIATDPGLYVQNGSVGDLYIKSVLNPTNWEPVSVIASNVNCGSNQYRVQFDFNNCPGGQTLQNIYSILNNSSFYFKMNGCCCDQPGDNPLASANPTYQIKTYLKGLSTCEIPMTQKEESISLHCPGCKVPGIIVSDASLLRANTSYGYLDTDDNGLADVPLALITQATPGVKLMRSIVGDDLISNINARFVNPDAPLDPLCTTYSVDQMRAGGRDLVFCYIEQQILNSESNKFDLSVTDVTVNLTTASNVVYTFNIPAASIHHQLSSNIYFYNLSRDIVRTLISVPNFEYHGGELFNIVTHFHVNQNYAPNNSMSLSDNVFSGKMTVNMYFKADDTDLGTPSSLYDLISSNIFDAYTSNSYPSAQSNWTCQALPSDFGLDCLYNCETRKANHYFYSLRSIIKSGIRNNTTGTTCIKSLFLDQEVSVGGDLINAFPNEFRKISINSALIHLPGIAANYAWNQADANRTYSVIRNYNQAGCSKSSFHKVKYNSPLNFSTLLNTTSRIASEVLPFNIPQSPCNDDVAASQSEFYASDEYFHQVIEFPFEWAMCGSFSLDACPTDFTMPSICLNEQPNGSCNSTINLIEPAFSIYDHVTTPNAQISINSLTPIDAFSSSNDFVLRISNNEMNENIVNGFIYIKVPPVNFIGSLTVNNIAATQMVSTSGDVIWFFPLPPIGQSGGAGNLTSLDCNIHITYSDCPSTNQTLRIYYGWNCQPVSLVLPLSENSLCRLEHVDQIINFFSAEASVLKSPPSLSYSKCTQYSMTTSLTCLNGDLNNIKFTLELNDHSLQIDQVLFYTQQNAGGPLVSIGPVIGSVVSQYKTDYLIPNAYLPPSNYLHIGEVVLMEIYFTPQQVWAGAPANAPFTVDYNYQKYCGALASSHPKVSFDTYTHTAIAGECTHLNVQASASQTICSGSAATLSASVTGSVSGVVTYLWSNGQTGQSISVHPNIDTDYSVIATDNAGTNGTSSVVHVFVYTGANCCYPSDFVTFVDHDFSDITSSSLNINFIATQNKIVINGTFTVDNDFTFYGCSNIILGPGAIINVLPSFTLTLFDSHIYSCSDLSHGIIAQGNAAVVINGSTVEDALTAVDLQPNSSLNSKASYFTNNVIGINIGSLFGPSIPNSQVQLELNDTHFNGTGFLKLGYLGMPNAYKPLNNPYAGIRVSNALMLSIGYGPAEGVNTFDNLNFGIYGSVSNISIEKCQFHNIRKFDPTYPRGNFAGTGIYNESRLNPKQLFVTGRNDAFRPDFDFCETGILTRNGGSKIAFNRMRNCDVGIEARGANFADISLFNNTIDCNLTGISILSCDNAASLEISRNTINAGASPLRVNGGNAFATAIDIQNNNSVNNQQDKYVKANDIFLFDHGSKGIHLNSSQSYILSDNYITIKNDVNTSLNGISIENSSQNTISCNGINGTRVNQLFYYSTEAAIRIALSRENLISQNVMNQTSNGAIFHGDCRQNSYLPSQYFQKNEFGSHFYGLHYTLSAQMDLQEQSGNKWLVPVIFPRENAIHDYALYAVRDKYLVNDITGFFMPNPFYPAGWFQQDVSQPDLISDPNDCGEPPITNPGGAIPKLIEALRDSLSHIGFEKELAWQTQVKLYEYLYKNPDLLTSSNDLSDFFIRSAATSVQYVALLNIGKDSMLANQTNAIEILKQRSFSIYQKSLLLRQCDSIFAIYGISKAVQDSLTQVSDALTAQLDYLVMCNDFTSYAIQNSLKTDVDLLSQQNSAINSTEIYEENESQINDIYFSTVAINEEDSLFTYFNSIYAIASQCPLAGGPAVYRARTLLKMIYPEADFDDEFTCIQGSYVYKQLQNRNAGSTLYPNPTTGLFTLSYQGSSPALFKLIDFTGRVCLVSKLDSQSVSFTGNISVLDNGIYYYQVLDTFGNVQTAGKLILEK